MNVIFFHFVMGSPNQLCENTQMALTDYNVFFSMFPMSFTDSTRILTTLE